MKTRQQKQAERQQRAQVQTPQGFSHGSLWSQQEDLEVLGAKGQTGFIRVARVLGRTYFACRKRAGDLRRVGFTEAGVRKNVVVAKVTTSATRPLVTEYRGYVDSVGNTTVRRFMSNGREENFLYYRDRVGWGTKTDASHRLGWRLLYDALKHYFPTLNGEGRHKFMVFAAPSLTVEKIQTLTHLQPFTIQAADLVTWISAKLNEHASR